MANNKRTSKKLASNAAKTLSDKNASDIQKQLAASVLSQRKRSNQTGSEMEDKASMVLSSDKYSDETKALAGSVLSQSNKER